MKRPFARWMTALFISALLLTPTASMEAEPIIEEATEPAAEAIDDAVEEWDVELEDALDEPAESDSFDLDTGDDEGFTEPDDASTGLCTWPEGTFGDRDALFAGYVEQCFAPGGEVYEARNLGADLDGEARGLYDFLRTCVSQVAAGERASTEFTYANRGSLTPSMGSDILYRLIADCPYETYWFGDFFSISTWGDSLIFSISVSTNYALDEFTINTGTVIRVSAAAANARAIVAQYALLSDYDKLAAYRDEICNAVTYNVDATSTLWDPDNKDPWQLIWVFDGDPNTNVVCEGYAKAFQYLCDQSSFSGRVMCYCVTGYSDGQPHEWNIVRMPNGRNYLVDVTYCDQENTGTYDWLFMKAPESGSVYDGYSFTVRNPVGVVSATYMYDSSTLSIFSSADLRLSIGAYLDEAGLSPETANLDFTVDLPLSDETVVPVSASIPVIVAVNKSAWAYIAAAPGTVYQLDLAGETGRKFKSSNRKVATVNAAGFVTVKRAGKATISFKVGSTTRKIRLTITDPTIPGRVRLIAPTTSVKKGDVITLTPVIDPGTRSGFTWKSSNRRVATVKNGVVTFKKKGRVTITCTARRGKKKAKITFRVSKK